MPAKLTVKASPRTVTGRKVKQLRRQGLVPANVYGAKIKSFPIQLTVKEFTETYNEAGETSLVYLSVDGSTKSHPVLITKVQQNPVTDEVIHVDFREVVLTEKVTASIDLEIVGEAPAVKDKEGVLVVAHPTLEVEALPTDLPDGITVDISSLNEIGDSIFVKDLKFDREKVTLNLEPEETVVTIKVKEAEVVEEVAAPAEGEAVETEGEAPAAEAGDKADSPAEKSE